MCFGMRLSLGKWLRVNLVSSNWLVVRLYRRLLTFSRMGILTRQMGLLFCFDMLRGSRAAFCRSNRLRFDRVVLGQGLQGYVLLRHVFVGLRRCCGWSNRSPTIDCR